MLDSWLVNPVRKEKKLPNMYPQNCIKVMKNHHLYLNIVPQGFGFDPNFFKAVCEFSLD